MRQPAAYVHTDGEQWTHVHTQTTKQEQRLRMEAVRRLRAGGATPHLTPKTLRCAQAPSDELGVSLPIGLSVDGVRIEIGPRLPSVL